MTFGSETGQDDYSQQRPQPHPALAARFSPLAFDPGHHLADADEDVLLEAAG
jgi:hypothetical protein